MKKQSFENHGKWVIGYHLITFLAIILLIIGAVINLINSEKDNLYSASLIVLISVILLFMFYFLRAFSLKAQDRAIKVEQSLRYYVLAGKHISSKLTIRQLIGLRFASDEEFVDLAHKAEKEGLNEKEIKKAIKNWKADTYRV